MHASIEKSQHRGVYVALLNFATTASYLCVGQTNATDKMEIVRTPRRWNGLTVDAWAKALTFVSVDDLMEARLACRSMFQACESPTTWANRFNASKFGGEDTRSGSARYVRSVWVGRRSKGLQFASVHSATQNAPFSILKHMDRLENINVHWWYAYHCWDTWIDVLVSNPATCRRLKTLKVQGPVYLPSDRRIAAGEHTKLTRMFDRFADGASRQQDGEERPNKRPKPCLDQRPTSDSTEPAFPNLLTISLLATDVDGVKWLTKNAPNVVDLSFHVIEHAQVFDYVCPKVTHLTLGFGQIEYAGMLRTQVEVMPAVMDKLTNWTLLESLVLSNITPTEALHIANNARLPQIKELSVSMNLTLLDGATLKGSFQRIDWPVALFKAFPNVVRLRLAWNDYELRQCVEYDNFALDALGRFLQEPWTDHVPLDCVTVVLSDPTQEVDIAHLETLVKCDRINHVCLVVSKETFKRWEKTRPVQVKQDNTIWVDLLRVWRDSTQMELPGKLSIEF
jgi:hypothetical protein